MKDISSILVVRNLVAVHHMSEHPHKICTIYEVDNRGTHSTSPLRVADRQPQYRLNYTL